MDNREKQIRLAEQLIATGIDGELKKAIESQFPELKENEDEKIRKAISYAICAAAHQDGTLINNVTKDEAFAYLEKHKEQKLHCGSLECIECLKEEYRRGCKDTKKEQKPAEWNKEDKGILLSIKCVIDEVWHSKDTPFGYSKEELEEMWNWLDVAWQRLEYPKENKKWNEGTKKTLDEISDYLKYKGREEDADFIRHLRPQPQWKPSEEQMKALEQAMDRNDKLGYLLRELHDKLKNL